MTRKSNADEWYGKISYQGCKEEIKNPADVEKKIREGTVYSILKYP